LIVFKHQDLHAEDATQIMRALSVHRYCGSSVRLIVEMLKLENQDNPIWDDADGGIEIVCPEAIRYQLLARRFL
jgi:potassium large conductance calcium-activated channel subfamily M alpha protein 1